MTELALLDLLDVPSTSTPITIKLFETPPILDVSLVGSFVRITLGNPDAGTLIPPDISGVVYDELTGILTLPPLSLESLTEVLKQIEYVPDPLNVGGTNVTITVIDPSTGQPKDTVHVQTPSRPTDASLSSFTVSEGASASTFIGQLSSSDPDPNDSFTYALLSDAGGRFVLDGDKLKVAAGILLDFEQSSTHQITVRVKDSFGFTYDEVFTIGLGDVLHEVLNGTAAADTLMGGVGNDRFFGLEGNDLLSGGAGNDVLGGGAGADRLEGGAGDDIYYADISDAVVETSKGGTDTILTLGNFRLGSAVEHLFAQDAAATTSLKLTGNQLNNRIVGNSGANLLNGGKGNDVVQGGAGKDKILGNLGNDVLTGGAGKDAFVFQSALNKSKNVDKIADFKPVDDVFHLENGIFKGLKTGTLSSDAFHVGTAAADAEDRIVYDKSRGAVFFDRDGEGGLAAVKFAQVKAGTLLTAADFFGI